MLKSSVKIRTNLFILFLVVKMNGLFMWKFVHDGDYNDVMRNGNLFQNKRCLIGSTVNMLILCLYIHQFFVGIERCMSAKFSILNLLVLLLLSTTILVLTNTQFSHQSTVAFMNEAYKLMKLCRIDNPLPSRSMLLIGLPAYFHVTRIFMHPNPTPEILIVLLISTIQIVSVTSLSLFIILVLSICDKNCEKIITDLIALKSISPNACFFKLRRVLVSYMRLADFIESIAPVFGFRILCLVLEYFWDCYLSFSFSFSNREMLVEQFSIFHEVLPILGAQYRMVFICSISSRMQRKALQIEKHVEDLLIRAVLKDQYLLKTKLEAFKLEIQTRKYTITPYGLFSLDMDLYTSILTIMASNCALIVQLFNDETKKKKNTPGPVDAHNKL